jgi:hypothetical protein
MTTTATPIARQPQPGPAWTGRTDARLQSWLVARRNAGDTPADITRTLIDNGWSGDAAAHVSMSSLRSSDRHTLLYAVLTTSAGLAALGAATACHLGLADNPDPQAAATALTAAVAFGPVAVWCGWLARRCEAKTPIVIWSPSRRAWFATLAGLTGTVGLLRLLKYLYLLFAGLTGAGAPFKGQDIVQVVVTVVVCVPLLAWSWREWRKSNLLISGLNAP